MLHPETLAAYRRMTPSERLRITLGMIRASVADRHFGAMDCYALSSGKCQYDGFVSQGILSPSGV